MSGWNFSLAMSGIFVSNSEGILHTKLLFWTQTPWLVEDLITVIPCLEVSALNLCRLQCVQNSIARIVPNTTKHSHITPIRNSLHSLPIMHRSVFKTALLVYKFLHSGHPKYFEPFLKPRHSVYRMCRSQSDGVLLEVLILHQYVSLKAFSIQLCIQWFKVFEMICLMMYTD